MMAKKLTLIFILLALCIISACTKEAPLAPTPTVIATAIRTVTSTPTNTPSPVSLPSPTAISSLALGSPSTPTNEPKGDHYTLEFTNQVSSGFATLHATTHTCSGIHSSWEGTFDLVLDFEDMHISGSGPFDFTLPADQLTVKGKAPFSGGGTVSEAHCVILDVSDPLQFEITFSPDERTATVIMGSRGGGIINIQCPDSPVISDPFAVAWGPEPLVVPIAPYGDCP